MRVYVLLLIALVSGGCESRATAVASTGQSGVVVSTNGEASVVTEIPIDETETRLWLCTMGYFIWGDEFCAPNEHNSKSSRLNIQDTIRERYPGYNVTRILRAKEESYTVYYISLKKRP